MRRETSSSRGGVPRPFAGTSHRTGLRRRAGHPARARQGQRGPARRPEHRSFAHDVQAALVEHFSGMPFDAYCQEVIFAPLGMKNSVFGVPPERASRFAAIYHPGPDGQLLAGDGRSDGDLYAHFTGHPFGGVGLSTTAQDYLRFAQMLLNGGRLGGARILSRKTVELMRVHHLAPEATPVAPGLGYGLGVGVVTDPAQFKRLSSAGQFFWSGYATTAMFVDPKEQMVALLFAQYLPEDFRFIDNWSALVYQAIDD
ncbi:MAG TPA: serine hydrolase [Solirubrobacteraceae bacterium]|nr:serine hydrolase [Solirubrobacteraceae bacterium]